MQCFCELGEQPEPEQPEAGGCITGFGQGRRTQALGLSPGVPSRISSIAETGWKPAMIGFGIMFNIMDTISSFIILHGFTSQQV